MALSETFDRVAELYDRARPRYPAQLYDDLAEVTGVGPGARVLEIAPATGITTVELARRGYDITAVEMGRNLAAVAHRNLERFSRARVEVSRFEDWPIPDEPFELICCATAFSWLDPTVRASKCAALLKPGGHLAVWDTLHVDGGTSQFFIDMQECYERWMPGTEPGLRCPGIAEANQSRYGLDRDGRFEPVAVREYPVVIAYTTETYLEVIQTYSGHIDLSAENAEGLYACIRELMDLRYGGRIEKQYLFYLQAYRRNG